MRIWIAKYTEAQVPDKEKMTLLLLLLALLSKENVKDPS